MFFKVTSAKKLSKYFLVTILVLITLFLVLFLFAESAKGEVLPQNGQTAEQRAEFIKGLGYKLQGGVAEEVKTVEIPYKFSDVYEEYNRLQKKAGYDLKNFSGKKVELYTVKIDDENRNDVYAHLLIFEGSIIGGDISAVNFRDGYMLSLIKQK